MQRLAKPSKPFNDKEKAIDKIDRDEMNNYKLDPNQDNIEIPDNSDEEKEMEQIQNEMSEEEKQGKKNAEELAKKYNLPNSYNADSIQEPHLREYVQALLTYYNSWGDYDGGFINHCEKRVEIAEEALYQYEQTQKKKANRIVARLKKNNFRTPDFSETADLAIEADRLAKSLNEVATSVKGCTDFDPDDAEQFSGILEQINGDVQALHDIANEQVNGHDAKIDKSKPYSNIW
jgi:methyl-accepting chemotaxis protein